jgi:hypothetical protein
VLPKSPKVQRARTFTLPRGGRRVYIIKVNLLRRRRAGGSTGPGGTFPGRPGSQIEAGSYII